MVPVTQKRRNPNVYVVHFEHLRPAQAGLDSQALWVDRYNAYLGVLRDLKGWDEGAGRIGFYYDGPDVQEYLTCLK